MAGHVSPAPKLLHHISPTLCVCAPVHCVRQIEVRNEIGSANIRAEVF